MTRSFLCLSSYIDYMAIIPASETCFNDFFKEYDASRS